MMKNSHRSLIPLAGLLVLTLLLAGCGTVQPMLEPLLSMLTPQPTPTPPPSNTPTPTRTPITFITWTPTPEGYNYTQGAPTRTASPTLRPSWTPLPTKTPIPTWTPSPTLTPTLTPSPTATLPVHHFLYESFNDPNAHWLKSSGSNWATWIEPKGVYSMEVSAPNVEITSSQMWLHLAEVRMEADIAVNKGEGYYGFACRDSGDIYYTLFIDSEGNYGLGQTVNGKVEFLIRAPAPPLKPGHGVYNHVVGECRGNTLKLIVNGVELITWEVDFLGPGYAGMMTGTRWDQEYVLAHFDNFEVWATDQFNPDIDSFGPTPEP